AQVAPMKRPTSTRQTEHRASIGMAAGKPSWTILTSVPTDTGCRVTVVIISPSRFGSAIRVADELIWNEIQVLAAADVHLAGGEICEWHSVGAARLGVHLVHCACEPVGRQPARHSIRGRKGPVDFVGLCSEHTVQAYRVGRGTAGRSLFIH